MAKIRDIQRTAAFAWAPDTEPFIATGTQAGAVAADFSDNTQLELWDLDLGGNSQAELSPVASVNTDSKFYDIAWGRLSNDKPRGIIAGALENGSLDLWSADALLDKSSTPLISQTAKHSGAIKSLQFNPFKPELLATAGAKGELYVWDLNNTDNPFMLGNKVARADDFDCLDWNKKVPHILVTGGSGGFLTVWDVKTKKESLTLNNLNRKAVSAVAWHPEQQTKLITAIPDDTNPVILMWDLRNSHAPERTLTGHSAGVLSLSWCKQDSDLLLSCGKDNRTICWNPQSGEMLGEFPVVTNWTFKTTFHPRNPAYIATASYDGKIAVRTLQNTNPEVDAGVATQDGDDFFSRASNAQTSSFSLKQTPKWLQRPAGATFGFGGKLVSFSSSAPNQSKVKISTVAIDSGVNAATERFEKAVEEGNLVAVCDEKTQDAKSEDEKSEWQILKALFYRDTKSKLVEYLGFKAEDIATPDPEKEEGEEGDADGETKEEANARRASRLSAFFADGDDSENFLASLSIQSTQTARTNNPFRIYTGDETDADKAITKAVVLGEYERAVDVCLKEDRISDAFMLAICGGDKCIDKVKAAYFTKKHNGPNYLRLLASVVGKNLWDVVHNADIANWKEVVVALCTHGDDKEFHDLIEALGDRLEEEFRSKKEPELQQAALFCYLAGSKLHKVVGIWVTELHETEKAGLQEESEDSTFSVHARSLQNFIEKVTVFREAVKFVDDEKNLSTGWKLNALYEKYCEYADVVASHGQLSVAGKYLNLLPSEYPAAQVARNRVKQATTQAPAVTQTRKPQQPATTAFRTQQPFQPAQPTAPVNAYIPPTTTTAQNLYTPSGPAAAPAPYQQTGGYRPSTTYQPSQVAQPNTGTYAPQYPASGYTPANMGQPPRFAPPTTTAPPPPPPKQGPVSNWNDTPEVVRPPRRATPAAPPQPSTSPFPNAPPGQSPTQPGLPWGAPPPRATPPPPPKGSLPPQRVQSPAGQYRPNSPAISSGGYQQPPPQSQYAPQPPAQQTGRYTPQPVQNPVGGPPGARPGMPPPPPQGTVIPGRSGTGPQYAPPPTTFGQQPPAPSQYTPQQPQQTPQGPYAPQQPQQAPQGPYAPPQGSQPPQGNYAPPLPSSQGPPPARPGGQHATAPPPKSATPTPQSSKHPKGDRSHIPAQHMVIYELLTADMERVKARAPSNFSRQVSDTEKRLGILFDHINNEELLSAETLESMGTLARAL
ncbi:WD40 repeat-like protein, partial [Wilcoxina mikolae CBS 423.85]